MKLIFFIMFFAIACNDQQSQKEQSFSEECAVVSSGRLNDYWECAALFNCLAGKVSEVQCMAGVMERREYEIRLKRAKSGATDVNVNQK